MSQVEKVCSFPVFAAQGGGLVREIRSGGRYSYIFVEAPPDGMGLSVGDTMPPEWDIVPVNQAAKDVVNNEQRGAD